MTGSDEIRLFYHPLTSQNSASLLGVGSAPATTVRENPRLRWTVALTPPTHLDRTHMGNIGLASGPCQRTSPPLCIRVSRNRAPTAGWWESKGWSETHSHCSAQFTSLITPNISIETPDAHLADGRWSHTGRCDGQTHTVPTRFYRSARLPSHPI